MERQQRRHHNCPLTFECFNDLEAKSADCPVCLRLSSDWHCLGADHPRSQPGATGSGDAAGSLPLPRYPDSVHIFGDMVSGDFQPVGTCFAISPQHLLTVRHHMESNRLVGYGIVPYVSRRRNSSAVEIPRGFPRPVRVLYFNTDMDYAILEIRDGGWDLVPIPISLEVVEAEMALKIYHCPVDLFNDERVEDLTVFSGCVQTARPTAHHVTCNVGLYSGSSGGPFISCRSGGAVGMHVESVPTAARDVDPTAVAMSVPTAEEAAEIVSDTENSRGTNHASFSRALLFRTCPNLIRTLQQLRILK